MSTRNTDINLIIKARTEGEKLVEGLAGALEKLFGNAHDASGGVAELGQTVDLLNKAFGTISSKADQAEAAFNRQKAAAAATRAELAELKQQASAAAAELQRLNSPDTIVAAGRDQTGRLAQIKAAQAAQAELATSIARLSQKLAQQDAAISGSVSSLQRLSSSAIAVQQAQREASQRFDATTAAINRQTAAAERAAVVHARVNEVTRVSRTPATSGGATFSALDADSAKATRDAKSLRDALNPAAAEQARLNALIARYQQLLKGGHITTAEFVAGTRLLRTESEKVAKAFTGSSPKLLFGLRPYELQNLGYQVNDVVTQLASGTSLSQTLSQQGGQILQLFPRVGGAIVGALTNPAILGGVATVGAFALAIKHAADEAERLRHYTGELGFRANGGQYNAAALANQERDLAHLGNKSADARAALSTFLDDGVAPGRIDEFARAASNLAEVLGIKLTDAAKQVAEAFTGDYRAVAELDNKLNFLSAAQREHIRSLFESGKAAEARSEALSIFEKKADDVANKERGSWSDATRNFGAAWDSLLEKLSNRPTVQLAINAVNDLADAMDRLSGGSGRLPPQAQIDDATKYALGQIDAQTDAGKPGPGDTRVKSGDDPLTKESNDTLNQMQREHDLQQLRQRGSQAVENLRRRNESFLTAAEQRRREALAGELAATAAIGDQRVKDAARANAVSEERIKIQQERDAFDAASSSPAMVTRRLIMERESFSAKAYRDSDSRFRVGYGSDQMTSAGGAVSTVTSSSRTTQEAALRDLDRRIGEFQNGIKELIGSGRFDAFNSQQQAALTSVAYNYGTLGRTAGGHGAGIVDVVRTGTISEISAAIRSLGRDNGGVNGARRNAEADLFSTPNAAIEADNEEIARQTAQRQNNFNQSLRKSAEDHERLIAQLRAENGLRDTALIAEQRQQSILAAELELRQKFEEANKNLKPGEKPVQITEEQVKRARDMAAAEFDAAHARELLNAGLAEKQRPVDELREQIELLHQQADALRAIGNERGAEDFDHQAEVIEGKLRQAVDDLIAAYQRLTPAELATLGTTKQQLDNILRALGLLKQRTQEWGKVAGVSAESIAHAFASQATQSIMHFLEKVGQGKNVFKSFGESVAEFAAGFIQSIAQMIIELLAFAAAVQILRALGVPVPSNAFMGVGSNHMGGTVGGGAPRMVSPAVFAGAMRFHTGGIVGLKPDEMGIIAKRGEEVLTQADPRHRMNGGLSPAGGGDLRVINVFDKEHAAEMLLRTRAGEKAILNFVTNNKSAFRAALN